MDKQITTKEVKKSEMSEQDKRCVPIAEEVLQIIAKHKPSLNTMMGEEELTKVYAPIYKELAELFLAKNLKYVDINYIMKIAQLSFDNTNAYVNQRMEEVLDKSTNKLFGVDNFREITLQHIDNVLKLK